MFQILQEITVQQINENKKWVLEYMYVCSMYGIELWR